MEPVNRTTAPDVSPVQLRSRPELNTPAGTARRTAMVTARFRPRGATPTLSAAMPTCHAGATMSDPEPSKEDLNPQDGVISPLRFLSGGLEFAATCLAGALAGRWLDARFGTDPWFTATLLILAFVTATWLLLRALSVVGNRPDDDGTTSR